MTEEELAKSPVIRMAGSDGETYEATADLASEMAAAAREAGVALKPFVKTTDAEGNLHEISPFDGAALKEAEERGDERHFEGNVEEDYFSAEALKAGAARFAIGLVNPWDWLRGIGTAAGTVVRGLAKGTVGTVLKAAQGATYLGESISNAITGSDDHTLSEGIGKVNDVFEGAVDAVTPDLFELTGEYDGVAGAKGATGAVRGVAEMVANVKGIGKLTKLMQSGGASARAAHAMTGAMFGAGKYGDVASDPNGPGGWKQQAAAIAAGTADAVIFGLWNPFKISAKYAAELKPFAEATRREVTKRVLIRLGQAFESGASMATVEAVKQGAEQLAGIGMDGASGGSEPLPEDETTKTWGERTLAESAKEVGAQFLVGSAFAAIDVAEANIGRFSYNRARKAQGDLSEGMKVAMSYQVERNRKAICPKYHEQASYAYNMFVNQGGRAQSFKDGFSMGPDVRRINEDGSVVFDDGSVWRPDPRTKSNGAYWGATITVSDGTILSETGELLGYRARRENGITRAEPANQDSEKRTLEERADEISEQVKLREEADAGTEPRHPESGEKAESNALLLLQQIDEGKLPVEEVAIGDVEAIAPTENGNFIEEYDAAKAKPIVVWEDLEGNRHAVTGGKRLLSADASGAETIKAVVVREADGWSEADAHGLGATENLREGRGTIKNVVDAVETLGADKVAEIAEWHQANGSRDFASTLRKGLAVAHKGAPELKAALAEGRIGDDFAYNAAQVLSMERVGEGWEAAQRELAELIGKVGPEELEAVLWGLKGRLTTDGASGGPEPLPKEGATVDWKAAIAEERAKYNAKKGGADGKLDSDAVLMETEDNELKTLGEVEAENGKLGTGNGELGTGNGEGIRTLLGGPNPREYSESPTSGSSVPNNLPRVNEGEAPNFAAAQGAAENKAVELRPAGDKAGAFTTLSHPEARFTVDGETRTVAVDGLTEADFEPGRIGQTAALIAKVEAYAANNLLKIGFGDDGVQRLWETVRENIKAEGKEAYSAAQVEAKRKTVLEQLKKSGLAEEVVESAEEFNRLYKELSGEPLRRGEEVYGFCDPKTKKIYLNPEFFATQQGLEVPIHEFGHLGVIACEKVNKAVYDQGMKLAKELLAEHSSAIDAGGAGEKTGVAGLVDLILNDRVYSKQSREQQAQELLAQLVGKRGEEALRAESNKSVVAKVKAWLVEFWNTFGKALGLKDITPEEAAKMTVEDVADAIRAEMLSGRKYGEGLDRVEFSDGGARVRTKPARIKRRLTGRRKAVNDFVAKMGGAEDPANTETDLLALWVDNGGRLFDKIPYEVETGYSKGKSGVKLRKSSVADEFAESTAFYKDLNAAQRKVYFGTEKLEHGAIGGTLAEKLDEAGITRFTKEDGTVDYNALIGEFERQWTNYERGEAFLKERGEWAEEHDRAIVEEMERAEAAEREAEAAAGDEASAAEAEARAAADAAGVMFSRAVGSLTGGKKNGRLSDVDQKRLTAVMRGLGTGELKHPRFTTEEFAASKGTEHEQLWNYILSLESPDLDGGGAQAVARGEGGANSKGSERLGRLRRVATRYGRDPKEIAAADHKYFDRGAESRVYDTGEGTVIKVRRLDAYDMDGVKHALAKIVYHNYLFPKDAYRLHDIAVWKNGSGRDEFYMILEQPMVTPKRDANGNIIEPSQGAIFEALKKTGQKFNLTGGYYDNGDTRSGSSSSDVVESAKMVAANGDYAVYDFKPGRNTFIDAETGEVRFIDPRIDINDPTDNFAYSKFGKRRRTDAWFDIEAQTETARRQAEARKNASEGEWTAEDESRLREQEEAAAALEDENFDGSPSGQGGRGLLFSRAVKPSALGDGKQRYYEVKFEDAVDKIVKNKKPVSDEHVFISETPQPFKDIGMPALPVMMNQSHVLSCYFGKAEGIKGGNMHGLRDRLKSLPRALAKPMMIIANESNPSSSVIAIVKLVDKDGHTVIAPVEINGIGRSNEGPVTANIVKSAFGKKNLWSEKVAKALRDEVDGKVAVFYVDSNEARQISNRLAREAFNFGKSERQLLSVTKGTVHSLSDFGSPVKGVGAQTDSHQFKRWFAESKVVDANGEPLVVYRGAEFDPLAQESGKGVIMPEAYFTADPEYAKRYTGNGGKVHAYYLNIRNPFDIRDPECLKDLQKIYPDHEFQRGKSGALDWGEASIVDGEFIKENFGDKYDGIIYDEGGDPTDGGPTHRGISYVPLDGGAQVKSATDNIGTFDPGNNDIRFSRGGKPPEAEHVKLTRVADDAGQGEQTPGAMAASRELSRQGAVPINTKGTRYVSLPMSEMNALARYLTGHALPAEMESGRKLGAAGKASYKHRKLTIAADVLGVVDKTDMAAEKAMLKQHGFFAHEDSNWCATHSPAEVRKERERSEEALSSRLEKIADKRIAGREPGGMAAGRKVFADQLAKVVMAMPHGQPGALGAMQTVAGALEKRVRGSETEAETFLDWMEGVAPGGAGRPARSGQERKAGMFAAFLIMPKEMEARAKGWYDAIRSTIAGDQKLADAFRKMTARMMSEQGHAHLESEILRMQDAQTEAAIKKLQAESNEPIKAGGKLDQAKETVVLSCDDRMGAAVVRVDAAAKVYLAAQKRLMAAAKTPAEKARIKQQTDVFMGQLAQAKNQAELSRTAWERGRNNADARYLWRMVDLLNEATVRDGLRVRDLSLYLDQMRVIETRGLSGSRGESARQAQLIIDAMRKRLGADFAKVEAFARRFHAIHEQELLNNPLLEKILGKGTADYWRSQTSYVTTKRTFSPEELAEIEAARRTLAASGAAGGDTVVGQMFKYCGRPEAMAKLKGSFADKQEVMSATFEKVAEVQRFLRRSEYVIRLRDMLKLANVEGVHDMPAGKNEFKSNNRYGSISYMENGQKRTLVVPREIADGFDRQSMYNSRALKICAAVNNVARQLWIDWNPVYWHRNLSRNAGSIEMNMPGMRESIIKRGARFVFPGLAPVTEMAMTHLVRHLPERMSLGLRKIWGEHTALYYAPKAKRMAMWLTDHSEMQRRLWEAEKRGDLGAVQEMEEDRRDMLAALKANMLVGISAGKASGTAGFLDDSVKTVGKTMQREMQDWKAKSRFRKVLDTVNIFSKNAKQQVFEDIMAKFSAYLHDRAQFGIGNNRTAEESGLVVKKNVSIGEGERKGETAGITQAIFQPFWNMVEKGVVRNVKAYKERPAETFGKAAWRIAPMLLQGLIGSGAVAAWILKSNDGDEEKVKNGPMGDVYRYLRDAQRAYQNCSNYVRNNYHVTPLWTDGYTSIVIGMPLTDEERLLKPIARFVADAASVASGTKESLDVSGFLSDATGVIAPDFKIAGALPTLLDDTVHAFWENPEDYYTGGQKYDKDTWALRNESWEMRGKFTAAMAKRLWNDFGGRNVLPVDRAGVDNGLGRAPGWVAKMVNDIPVVSPILRSFVKVQVGSPKRDAAEITEAEARRRAVCRVCAKELFETAHKAKGDISLDQERYNVQLQKWKARYDLTDEELADIEGRYLNAWRSYEGAQYRADGEREKYRAKAERLGLDAAHIWLDFD